LTPPVPFVCQTISPVAVERDDRAVEQGGEHQVVHDGCRAQGIARHLRVPDDAAVRRVDRDDFAVLAAHLPADLAGRRVECVENARSPGV
jgi:hypothetical protein